MFLIEIVVVMVLESMQNVSCPQVALCHFEGSLVLLSNI